LEDTKKNKHKINTEKTQVWCGDRGSLSWQNLSKLNQLEAIKISHISTENGLPPGEYKNLIQLLPPNGNPS